MAVLLGAELNAEIEKLWPHERQRTSKEVSAFSDDGRSLG
jgi:hypothetical protein